MKAIYYFILCSFFFVSHLQADDLKIEMDEDADAEVATQSSSHQTMTLGIYYSSAYQWYQGSIPCYTPIASIKADPYVDTARSLDNPVDLNIRVAAVYFDTYYKDRKPTVTITYQSGEVLTLILNAVN